MQVKLIAHTQLAWHFALNMQYEFDETSDGQIIALSAIRTCYSHNKPSEIADLEGEKYFGNKASDEEDGTEADRLIRHIMNSGHTSTMEHLTFTFAIEGVSRSLLAQLTRHRHFSYSVQSQRYVKFGINDRSGGFDYVVPPSVKNKNGLYGVAMERIQKAYDDLRTLGVKAEDARMVLPNAAACNLVLTGNLRSLLEFYSKRGEGTHAQWEIKELAELIKKEVVEVEPWTEPFFKVEK